MNEPGGYTCRCLEGFKGNGYDCEAIETDSQSSEIAPTPNVPSLAPEHWLCDQCSDNADCFQGVCQCRQGWTGDGFECSPNCPEDLVWSVDRCVAASSEEEGSSFYNFKKVH